MPVKHACGGATQRLALQLPLSFFITRKSGSLASPPIASMTSYIPAIVRRTLSSYACGCRARRAVRLPSCLWTHLGYRRATHSLAARRGCPELFDDFHASRAVREDNGRHATAPAGSTATTTRRRSTGQRCFMTRAAETTADVHDAPRALAAGGRADGLRQLFEQAHPVLARGFCGGPRAAARR